MDKEIAQAPEDHLMQADEEAWIAALVERYSVEAPQLLTDEWWMDPPAEVKVDVRYDPGRDVRDPSRPALVNGVRHVIHVPFRGEADLFRFTPSTRDYNPPSAEVRDGEVVLDRKSVV